MRLERAPFEERRKGCRMGLSRNGEEHEVLLRHSGKETLGEKANGALTKAGLSVGKENSRPKQEGGLVKEKRSEPTVRPQRDKRLGQ